MSSIAVAAEPSSFDLVPGQTALIVIDMQRDFLLPGGFGESLGNDVDQLLKVVPPLAALIAAAREAGMLDYWTKPLDFAAFPSVLLAIALSGALGAGIGNALLSLTLVFVPQVARIAESVTAQVRHMDYIDAARATGASALTIIRVQVLGNVLGPIFVFATSLISVSMILASGLSFLGLGTPPPTPSCGTLRPTRSPPTPAPRPAGAAAAAGGGSSGPRSSCSRPPYCRGWRSG